jgi:ATP-binding cassette subfamily G (WHITE) protein 2 (PDR)
MKKESWYYHFTTTYASSHQAEYGNEINFDSSFYDDAESDSVITELARRLTAKSSFPPDFHQNPFNAETGSSLDPSSENFRPRSWAEALIHLQSQDPETSHKRSAGTALRNLNIHGFGNPTDYQKSVGSVWLELVELVRKIARTGANQRIEILREFDGLVKSGEMIVALGPPVS